jgi:hypothetical protein
MSDKAPEGLHKLKDFEFDRINYTRESLLHYFNSMMLIHASAFNTFSSGFEKLNEIDAA